MPNRAIPMVASLNRSAGKANLVGARSISRGVEMETPGPHERTRALA